MPEKGIFYKVLRKRRAIGRNVLAVKNVTALISSNFSPEKCLQCTHFFAWILLLFLSASQITFKLHKTKKTWKLCRQTFTSYIVPKNISQAYQSSKAD